MKNYIAKFLIILFLKCSVVLAFLISGTITLISMLFILQNEYFLVTVLHKGYKSLNSSRKIYVSRHVEFNKSYFLYQSLFHSSNSVSTSVSPSYSSLVLFLCNLQDIVDHHHLLVLLFLLTIFCTS